MADGRQLELYGAKLDAGRIKASLEYIFEANLEEEAASGQRPTPVCIWGEHGIGKTRLVQELAHERGWKMAYCAPAQFEEMGDLHGLPVRHDPDPDVIGDETTVYLPPDWVPDEPGPGLLLLDDVNRADDRILRGIMQLLQNFEMFSWTLPPKWQIVATANPEGGDYSVTPMDDAMLTRMLHMTMRFDVKAWAAWATRAGVDPRGIAFALTYPEVITGKRTTARSLTQFFAQIKGIRDLKEEIDLVAVLAAGALDDVTVTAFLAFVQDNLQELVSPEEILEAEDFGEVRGRLEGLATQGGAKRVDLLATICTRLYLALSDPGYRGKARHGRNLVEFMLFEPIPNDLRFGLHRDLTKLGDEIREMLRDKRLAERVLVGM